MSYRRNEWFLLLLWATSARSTSMKWEKQFVQHALHTHSLFWSVWGENHWPVTDKKSFDRVWCIFVLFFEEKGLPNRNRLSGWLSNQSETGVHEWISARKQVFTFKRNGRRWSSLVNPSVSSFESKLDWIGSNQWKSSSEKMRLSEVLQFRELASGWGWNADDCPDTCLRSPSNWNDDETDLNTVGCEEASSITILFFRSKITSFFSFNELNSMKH